MLIVSHSAVRMVDSGENPPEGATPLQLVIQQLFLKHKPCVRVLLGASGPLGGMERAGRSQQDPWKVE